MEIENSLYYSYSTLAQVLAAFIALSGVFVIFKLQELKRMQLYLANEFINFMSGIPGLRNLSFYGCPSIAKNLKVLTSSENTGGMLSELQTILNEPHVLQSGQYKHLHKVSSIFKRVSKVKYRIILFSKISLFSGVLTIIFSLIILAKATIINFSTLQYLNIVGLIGLIASISSMVYVIITSLNEDSYLIKEKSFAEKKLEWIKNPTSFKKKHRPQ